MAATLPVIASGQVRGPPKTGPPAAPAHACIPGPAVGTAPFCLPACLTAIWGGWGVVGTVSRPTLLAGKESPRQEPACSQLTRQGSWPPASDGAKALLLF